MSTLDPGAGSSEDLVLARVKQLLEQHQALKAAAGPPDPMAPPEDGPMTPPAIGPDTPYNWHANELQGQASKLESQAAPPPAPHGMALVGKAVQAGLEGFTGGLTGHPGMYFEQEAAQKAQEHQRQQDLLNRAKELRGEAQGQQQLGLTALERQTQNQRAQAQDEWLKQRATIEDRRAEQAAQTEADRMKLPMEHNIPAGGKLVITDHQGNVIKEINGDAKEQNAQHVGGRLDGKDFFASFQGGKFYNPATGEDISGRFQPMPPGSENPAPMIQQYQDPVTKEWKIGAINRSNPQHPTITAVQTNEGATPGGTAGKLSGTAANRAIAAQSLEDLIPQTIQKIQANAPKLGALVGRGENFLLKVGIKDPELRDLQSELKSYGPLLSTLHGGRNTEYMMKEFEAAAARLGEDPTNAIAALKAQLGVARTIKNAQNEVLGITSPSGQNSQNSPGKAITRIKLQ